MTPNAVIHAGWCFFLTFCLATPVAAQTRSGVRVRAADPKAALQETAPEVSLQALPVVAEGPVDQPFVVLITVANKGRIPLKAVTIALKSPDFEIKSIGSVPNPLPAHGTAVVQADVVPKAGAEPTLHNLLFEAGYSWSNTDRDVQSTQTAAAAFTLMHPFADEAEGLPGGTAALLYLLLPVIPAFLAYRICEQLRLREPVTIPTFGAEDIPFAFFIAVTVAALRLMASSENAAPDYSRPRTLVIIVGISIIVGAIVPLSRGIVAARHNRKWKFNGDDNADVYLRKALLGPDAPHTFDWVTAQVNHDNWAGCLAPSTRRHTCSWCSCPSQSLWRY